MVIDGPPTGESQSSRIVEEAGKTIREFVMVLRDVLEVMIGVELIGSDANVHWMVPCWCWFFS